jgi:hypothetical protein
VFGRKQPLRSRLHHLLKKALRHFTRKQPLPVFGEDRDVLHRIIHAESHEPAKQQVVIALLHQQELTGTL